METTRTRSTETAWARTNGIKATLSGLTEQEANWICDFVYDRTDARATVQAEPYSNRERFEVVISGASQADAERTLASLRAGDELIWTDWEDDEAHQEPAIWAQEHSAAD